MGKSIFLYVRGDGDYSASQFEAHFNEQKVYEKMVAAGVKEKTLVDPEDESHIYVTIKEFGAVAGEFVSFVLDTLCDYDHLKAASIYSVEPVK